MLLWIVIGIAALVALFLVVRLSTGTKELPSETKSEALPPPKGKSLPPGRKDEKRKGDDAEPRQAADKPASPKAPPVESNEGKAPEKPKRVFADLAGWRKGLANARGGFIGRLATILGAKKEIDPGIVAELEEVMLTSDVGVKTTERILGRVKEGLARKELAEADAVWAKLREEAIAILSRGPGGLALSAKPTVVLMVGVNGVGKTTTIGKLATKFEANGKKLLLAAGDTFRAAAVAQLEVWGKRVGVDVVKGKEGGDPGAVAFEATTKAKENGADLLLVDTAGRLHTKAPLMDEIKKVRRTIGKALEGAPHETWLVVDATTGQNAIQQATLFKEAVDLTGVILTKLDGTAKGGIVLALADELGLPVRYVGLGERAEDLREFDAEEFVEALFGKPEGDETAA